MSEIEAQELKLIIENDIEKLAKKIEQFCVYDNRHYTQEYKNKLREIHNLFENL